MEKLEVDVSDMHKVLDVLEQAGKFHENRDRSNAALHLAVDVRHSPLTSQILAEKERVERILDQVL